MMRLRVPMAYVASVATGVHVLAITKVVLQRKEKAAPVVRGGLREFGQTRAGLAEPARPENSYCFFADFLAAA